MLRQGEITHSVFCNLPSFLKSGDLLVLNETRVIAARIFGTREPSGGKVEVLLLHPSASLRYDPQAARWIVLAKPGRRLIPGTVIRFGAAGAATVLGVNPDGTRELEFALHMPLEDFLAQTGRLPLPPYIHNDSREAQAAYQTIFAREPGSVAAPTASLHFTEDVFDALKHKGVNVAKIVLDVGLGTFRPMQSVHLAEHVMHAESFVIPPAAQAAIDEAKSLGRRVVAAGTTVMRALEGSAFAHGTVRSGAGETDIFIKPGFSFRVVDALITNFHLPRSTLLVLVSAFAGRENVLNAYAHAVRAGYRFFSFGDAMYIEP